MARNRARATDAQASEESAIQGMNGAGGKTVIWGKDGSVTVWAHGKKKFVLTKDQYDSLDNGRITEVESYRQPSTADFAGLRVFADRARDEGFISEGEVELFRKVLVYYEEKFRGEELARLGTGKESL